MKSILLLTFFILFFASDIEALTRRYRCMIRNAPATTITIGWELVNGNNSIVYYSTTDYGQDYKKYEYQVSPQRTVHAKGMHNHFVRLSKLKPNTVYYFVIKDSKSVSRRLSFKTLPDDHQTRLSVLGGGDSRNHKIARQNANKMVAKVRPHFVLFAGDMTGGDSSREWQEWLDDWQLTIAADGRMTAVLAARGNHERSDEVIVNMFDVPHPTVFYGLTFARGLLRVFTLNSMQQSNAEQLNWMGSDFKKSQGVAWRLAQYHHPIRPHNKRKHEQEYMRKYWAPLFFKYNIQLALECDSHLSKITWPIRATNNTGEAGYDEGFVRDPNGTIFMGEGGWGAPLRDPDDSKAWTRAIGSFNQIKWLMVDLNKVEIRTIKTENVNQVGELTDDTRFYLPNNIDLWEVGGAKEVIVFNKKAATFVPEPAQILMEIKHLKAKFLDTKAYLEWQCANEIPRVKFKVQVSTNKLFWKTISIVPGAGPTRSREHTYKYIDNTDYRGGKYYYRIVGIDRAGKEIVLESIEIRTLGKQNLEIIESSLSTGQLKIPIDLRENTPITLELYDTQRKRVFVRKIEAKKGYQVVPLNIRHLKEGYYLLEVSINGELVKKNIKIVP